MKIKNTPWKRVDMAVGFLVKNFSRKDPKILLGPKLTGVVADLVMPPGGHIEKDDLGPITASARETSEESGLRPIHGRRVAELRVTIREPRKKFRVHVVLFTEWTGRLKNKTLEFKWLKFLKLSEIPWEKMPGEKNWIEDVVTKKKRRLVHITCGKSRKDVLSVRTRPLH